jgi:hypothetical protein
MSMDPLPNIASEKHSSNASFPRGAILRSRLIRLATRLYSFRRFFHLRDNVSFYGHARVLL